MAPGTGPVLPVRFVDALWREDLKGATARGREAALVARRALEATGVQIRSLRPCGDEAGTALNRHVKLYVPLDQPRGPWGFVLRPKREPGGPVLVVIAFGIRHPPTDSSRWSVYQRAHYRVSEAGLELD